MPMTLQRKLVISLLVAVVFILSVAGLLEIPAGETVAQVLPGIRMEEGI